MYIFNCKIRHFIEEKRKKLRTKAIQFIQLHAPTYLSCHSAGYINLVKAAAVLIDAFASSSAFLNLKDCEKRTPTVKYIIYAEVSSLFS